jgi:Fe2+ transport system protein FeoA
MSTTLSDLSTGDRGHVSAVTGEALLRERIVELGFAPGVHVEVRGRAPLGDPIEVRLRGGQLAVRRDEAACVAVVPAPAAVFGPQPS